MRLLYILLCVLFFLSAGGCATHTYSTAHPHTLLIDPGHGGFDGGAVAEDGTIEKYLNLEIARYLHDLLYICGVPVILTRTSDTGLEEDSSAPIRQKKLSDMQNRLAMYNEASLVIAIHQNTFSDPQYSGSQLFYSTNHTDSVYLADAIRTNVVHWTQPQNTRPLKKATDSIYLLSHTLTPAVLVECGFLSNPTEREKLKTTAYQKQLAFAIAAGYWTYQATK